MVSLLPTHDGSAMFHSSSDGSTLVATVDENQRTVSAANDGLGQLLDRQPPRSLEAERAVLGSILLLPEVCDEVALVLRPEDFYDEAHQIIFRHILDMHDAGKRVDHMLLCERLKNAGQFDLVGGFVCISAIPPPLPPAAHAAYYAQIVHDKALSRSLIHASTTILRDAYDTSIEPREMLGRAEERIFAILDEKGTGELAKVGD